MAQTRGRFTDHSSFLSSLFFSPNARADLYPLREDTREMALIGKPCHKRDFAQRLIRIEQELL